MINTYWDRRNFVNRLHGYSLDIRAVRLHNDCDNKRLLQSLIDSKAQHILTYKTIIRGVDMKETEEEVKEEVKCINCDIVFPECDLTEQDGESYCFDCLHELFSECANCSDTFFMGDMVYQDDAMYCQSCFDDLFVECYGCNEIIPVSDAMYSDLTRNHYCSDCYDDRFCSCNGCGTEIPRDDACYNEEGGEEYCVDCYDKNDSRNIRDCGYKHNFSFYPEKRDKTLYFGVELEIETEGRLALAEILVDCDMGHNSLYVMKSDGSLNNGFEIVTAPCTLEYHKEQFHWQELTRLCLDHGARAHKTTTCGLHIHFDRSYFTFTELVRLSMFVQINKSFIELIARRRDNQYGKFKNDLNNVRKIEYNRDYNNKKCNYFSEYTTNQDRYECLNFQNYDTVEFRIPKSTLKYTTILATIEFLHSLSNFVKTVSSPVIVDKVKCLPLYEKYINENKAIYSNLLQYLNERNIRICAS